MITAVLKLSGPMQTWPAHSRGTNRPTHEAPTYSGLCGLARNAIGIGRDEPGDPLESTKVAVRIDKRGPTRSDFHSINPMPIANRRFQRPRQLVPNIENMEAGPYHPTVLTEREYLYDSVFICFISGTEGIVRPIVNAFETPKWQLFLGRKSCPPGPDLLLGSFSGEVEHVSRVVPAVAPNTDGHASVSVPVHWLYTDQANSTEMSASWSDQPAGPVGAYYQTRQRRMSHLEVPVVNTATEQRRWIAANRTEVTT